MESTKIGDAEASNGQSDRARSPFMMGALYDRTVRSRIGHNLNRVDRSKYKLC